MTTRVTSRAPGTWRPFGPEIAERGGLQQLVEGRDELVDLRHSGLESDSSGDPYLQCPVPSVAQGSGGHLSGEIIIRPGRTSRWVGERAARCWRRCHDDGAADATDIAWWRAVRRGDDRAFEALYQRYHRRIHAYVLGMVKDHGRAEDVTQEVFVSALRRMRATERPIAFKPWIYEIAKNACIDAFRRSKRAEEVSYDADDALAPADHSRLVGAGPTPDAAVAAKHDLESLCGAFGGLSETHHEILVLRELEGLSYAEIGRRMGMSRPAVESTLFRARRRLTEEYDDIVSGARCLRIQAIIQIAAQSRLGARDTRRLARHLAHCQPCRREALEAGLDRSLIARPPVRERVATRVAALLPVPGRSPRLRRRRATPRRPAAAAARAWPRTCRCSRTSSRAAGASSRPAARCWSPAWAPASACTTSPRRRTAPAASSHPRRLPAAHAAAARPPTPSALPATPGRHGEAHRLAGEQATRQRRRQATGTTRTRPTGAEARRDDARRPPRRRHRTPAAAAPDAGTSRQAPPRSAAARGTPGPVRRPADAVDAGTTRAAVDQSPAPSSRPCSARRGRQRRPAGHRRHPGRPRRSTRRRARSTPPPTRRPTPSPGAPSTVAGGGSPAADRAARLRCASGRGAAW